MNEVTHRGPTGRQYAGVEIHAAPGVHDAMMELIGRHVQDKDALIFEFGAGSGAFQLRMLDNGYENIRGFDLDPPNNLPSRIKITKHDHNLHEIVAGESPNVVLAIEVIEHVHNPTDFFRQVHRMLRNGLGTLIISTPNVVNEDSRRLMLTRGELNLFRKGALFSTGHVSILPFWLLEEIAQNEGFEVVERKFIGTPDRKGWRRFLMPIVNWFIGIPGIFIPKEARRSVCVAYVLRAL